jgi:hypothetical protein
MSFRRKKEEAPPPSRGEVIIARCRRLWRIGKKCLWAYSSLGIASSALVFFTTGQMEWPIWPTVVHAREIAWVDIKKSPLGKKFEAKLNLQPSLDSIPPNTDAQDTSPPVQQYELPPEHRDAARDGYDDSGRDELTRKIGATLNE